MFLNLYYYILFKFVLFLKIKIILNKNVCQNKIFNNIITRIIKFQIKSKYLYNSNKVKAMVKHLQSLENNNNN